VPKTSLVWISYDLGVRGDYESLYGWLDSKHAEECGDSTAVLKYICNGDIANSLKEELEKSISITRRTRVYVIYRDGKSNNYKGRFIFGGRKTAIWSGYAYGPASVDED
jgi:hypothetical protein